MLDTCEFSSIIYIWYEDGELSAIPCEVKKILTSSFQSSAEGATDASGAGVQ